MKFIVEIPRLPDQIAGHVEMEIYGAPREATMRVLHGALHDTLTTVAARFASDPARDHGSLISVHTVQDEELVVP